MLYLNKFLKTIKENPTIFKTEDVILKFGLTNTHIRELVELFLSETLVTGENACNHGEGHVCHGHGEGHHCGHHHH